MKYAVWNIPDTAAAAPEALLTEGYPPLLSALLAARGMDTPEAVQDFYFHGPDVLSPAMEMADMPAAVRRIRRAVEENEHVAVYGDYDVDGITASCLLTSWLRSKGLRTELYIPDRIEEGYGLNTAAIRSLYEKGVRLLITVDCGVTALAEAEQAAELGMDMIITDHHECKPELPNCVAVVDPKRPDCPGCKDLAGVGVAFKLVCAVEGSAAAVLDLCCDLVAVGTIADVMPLVGENRYIVHTGLQKLIRRPRPGLAALLAEVGIIRDRLGAMVVGFTLAPRLNAAGRLGKASLAAELLLCEDPYRCASLAAELCELNRQRQQLEQDIWQDAASRLRAQPPKGPIVLADENWHQGVIGIAASRMTEIFSLPAIIICLDGDIGKGSCRSFGGFNLFEALTACSQYLEGFGGHATAAGLTIRRENIPAFQAAMQQYYLDNPPRDDSALDVDLCINDGRLLDFDGVTALGKLEPYGCGNPRPVMCITNAVVESTNTVGGGRHLRLRLQKFSRSWDCIFFGQTEQTLPLSPGDRVDAAFFPQINNFHGRNSIQLHIVDLRKMEYLPLCRCLLSGALPPAREKYTILPQRADFARIWRQLKAMGGELSGSLEEVLDILSNGRHPGLTSLCLTVFGQLGLAEVKLTGDLLDIRIRDTGEKVDLENAPLLQQLREL